MPVGGAKIGLKRAAALATFASLFVLAPAVGLADVPPVPDHDPFYAVPARIGRLANGTVLASRTITAYAGLVPLPAQAWEVKYKTLDNQGHPTATVTTIMIPDVPWSGPGPRPLVSDQTYEDGVGAKCSPSYALHAGLQPGSQAGTSLSEDETNFMAAMLSRGWAVAAPDYEGPKSAFLGGAGEAREVLDGVRAALRFTPAGFARTTPVALFGYSGGSLASSLAAQLQSRYASALKLRAIVLGGEVADLHATAQDFLATPAGAAIIVGLIGLERSYPGAHLARYLNAAGKQLLAANQDDCLPDAIAKYPEFDVSKYEAVPDATNLPAVIAVERRASPLWLPGTPTAPVYDYHATDDEFAPIVPDRQLMARYCAAGVVVDHVENPVGEHLSETSAGFPGAMSFLASRFAGGSTPDTCRSGQTPLG
jgi:Secretory lipase